MNSPYRMFTLSSLVLLLEFTKILRAPRHTGVLDPGVRLAIQLDLGKEALCVVLSNMVGRCREDTRYGSSGVLVVLQPSW